jgi:subtilase family serine protease
VSSANPAFDMALWRFLRQIVTSRFMSTQGCVQYVLSNGFWVTEGTRDGMEVQIKETASAVESAFHVNIHTYQYPSENLIFYSAN